MQVVITDTNIIIDLLSIGLMPEFFKLKYQVNVSDMVFNELEERQQEDVRKYSMSNFSVVTFQPQELENLFQLKIKHPSLSIQDCSVLDLSKRIGDFVLTGDKSLRNKIRAEGITVRGIIFVIEEMVKQNIISKINGMEHLNNLKTINPRLPEKAINNLIQKWVS